MSVGSYITKETWLSNYGSKTAQKQNLHGFSSRGPAEDGGFKPNIVAPGSAISTTPRWQPGGPVAGTYALPPGYSQFNGTSMAAPQATGAAALLVSAFKATHNGQKPTSAELRYAIQRSANYVSTLGAYEQGAGLFNTNAAWTLLDKHSVPDKVTTSVAVNTVLSGLLATPNVGIGIHDREGVTAGQEYTRTYTLTRTTGHDDETYNVSWKGNDGTFTAPKKVELPLNKAVQFAVKVKAKTAGVHSAVLQLDNPETPGVDAQTLNTVFAAENFNAANKFSVTKSGKIARNQSTSLFVNVPKGTSALKVDPCRMAPRQARVRSASCATPRRASASTPTRRPTATTRTRAPVVPVAPPPAARSRTRWPVCGRSWSRRAAPPTPTRRRTR